jgi:hypothetical protein
VRKFTPEQIEAGDPFDMGVGRGLRPVRQNPLRRARAALTTEVARR